MASLNEQEIHKLGYAAPLLLKMLRGRESQVLGRIHTDYRSGKREFLEHIAEFVLLREQIREIETALKTQDTKE